jgi:ABC-type transporter Mla subunit MlaD
MKMHYSHRLSGGHVAQIVGAFVVIPLLGLVVVGIFMAKAEHLFEEKYLLHSTLSKSYGLEPGAPVMMSGVPIGTVKAVEFNNAGRIDVTLQLLKRFQGMVREDSVATVAKSGVLMGQTQVHLAMGDSSKPVLADGAILKATEPRDYAELVNEVKPLLESVQRTLLRVEEVTKDVQITVQTGGRALSHVEQSTKELPEIVASVKRSAGSVEKATATLPEITSSVKKTLAVVDRIALDVRATTAKLPAVADSAQEAVNNIKATTESIKAVSRDVPPIVRTAHATLNDVNQIITGAKKTFPVSSFIKNAEPQAAERATNGLRSLRGDQVGR